MKNEEKIIFRTKNDRNVIVEEEDCYILRAPKGEAVFDKKKIVLKAVLSAIERYGNAVYTKKKGFYFFVPGKNRKYVCSLGQIIYCANNGLSLSVLSGRLLKYMDGNPFNLRKRNVVMPHKQSVSLISICEKQYILVQTETENKKCCCAVVNADPDLFNLLSSLSWHYHKRDGCLRTTVGGKHLRFHHVVWAYFNYENISKSNLVEKVLELRTYLHINGLSVDHKKSSIISRWDNRIENLRLLPNKLNGVKGDRTSKLHGDQFYIPTTSGEIYGRYDWAGGYIDLCENECDATVASIDQLRRFCKAGEFQETDNHYKIPLNSPKGVEIQQADFRETKLYSEVLIYD